MSQNLIVAAMPTCLLFVLFALQLRHSSGTIQVYEVTVRDFLPIWCMSDAEMKELDIFGPDLTNNTGSSNSWLFNTGSDGCPYQAWIDNGTIAGHPDFNRYVISSGWNMDYLFDIEDALGADSYVTGSCDVNDMNGEPRPPTTFNDTIAGECLNRYEPYTSRMNLTTMDIAPSGLPKPQYCMSGETSRCGYFISGGQQAYQAANKFFQDLYFIDHRKYNKRIGSTLNLYPEGNGVFEFDSRTDSENDLVPVPNDNLYAPHGHSQYIFDESEHPDPFEAPAWPRMGFRRNSGNPNEPLKDEKKYLHTSEVHIFFEYQGNEVFSFSGDDDVWIYINNRIAIDLGGRHARASQRMNLSSPFAAAALNLTVGEIYTFDMFQAERQPTGSNFQLTTTLSTACNVVKSGKNIFPSATGDVFKKSRGVVLDHTPGESYAGQEIQLITSGMEDAASFIFSEDLLNVGTGFIVNFDFIATGEASGFTFLLHRRENDLTNFPKSSGGSLGFRGVKNSIAIAFDFCSDRDEVDSRCIDQDVTVYFPDDASSANKPSLVTRRVYDPIIRSLKYGENHTVRIEYFFKPPALQVTIDNSLYLRQMPFDPIQTLGSVAAFAGFTATSGSSGSPGTLTINNWKMSAVDVESSETVAVDFDPNSIEAVETKSIIADGISSDGVTIQTRDFCEAAVEFGGRSTNAGGIYVEQPIEGSGRRLQTYSGNATEPLIIDVTIEDNDDGKYGFNLISNTTGLFSAYFFYGDSEKDCTFNYTLVENNTTGLMEVVVTTGNSSEDGCFYGQVENAVQVFPLTSPPTAAPIEIAVPEPIVDDTLLYVMSVGGGTIGFFGLLACALFAIYGRRWRRDKEFIEEGRLYKMEATTDFADADELTAAGRQVQASQAAILRIRQQRARDAREKELAGLQQENDELSEQIRMKRNAIEKFGLQAAPEPRAMRRKPQKIEL